MRRETLQGHEHAALLLGDRGQAPALLTRLAGPQRSRDVLSARAPMGFADGEPGGPIGVHCARGRVLGRPQLAQAYEPLLARRGAGRRQALGRSRAQTPARARTGRVRAATRARGTGEETLEWLHGRIPSTGGPEHQAVPAGEAGQPCRLITNALCGVSSLGGSHGHLRATVLSTLGRCEGRFLAHDNPMSLTG